MNDEHITESVNNLVSQPEPHFGLGSNPNEHKELDKDSSDDSGSSDDQQSNDSPAVDNTSQNAGDDDQTPATDSPDSDLTSIKQQALQQLSPLVEKLDQKPEEKYRTLMMMIQSSDDKTLIKAAYDAATKIEDEAKKAEALLNIVNEINYFSQGDKVGS